MNATTAKKKAVKVSITTLDGLVLDQFVLSHWEHELPDTAEFGDQESYGSTLADSALVYRLKRDVEVVLPGTLRAAKGL